MANMAVPAGNLDTTTATGRMMMNVIGSVAQFERELMLERQRIGIQKAKEEGKYKGRPPQKDVHSEIKRLRSQFLPRNFRF